jgi:hypothetical protein
MRDIFRLGLCGLRHRGVQILLIITAYLLVAEHLPLVVHQALYTVSLFIKELLVWMLPITVGLFIAHTIGSFRKTAPLFVITIILFEGFSNLSTVWYTFFCGHIASEYLPPIQLPSTDYNFSALWHMPFTRPSWWSSDKGSIAGLILGGISVFFSNSFLPRFINRGKDAAQYVLTHVFSPLIPLFVMGFVARMYQTQLLHHVIAHCSILLVWLVFFLATYIAFLFFIGSDYSLQSFVKNIRNLLPAGAIAFTSGCSLSTMPWTINGTSKNLHNPALAQAVIPATTNIQQIGDCITNTFLCFLIYKNFYGISPDFATWLSFSVVFVLARFATAAVLGGAIFIMLPIYESYLSFDAEMIAIILAFNVILDPLVTSSNVVANGALCRVFEKVWITLIGKDLQPEKT